MALGTHPTSLATVRIRSGPAAAVATVALAAVLGGCGGSDDSSPTTPTAASASARALGDHAYDLVERQVAIGPRPTGSAGARREVSLITRELRAAGLMPRVQHPLRNVVATLPGTGPGTVVVGAHYDTIDIPGFVGANDGASGVAVLLVLARSLPRPVFGRSVTFAFFDAEEAPPGTAFEAEGSAGSRQFVELARTGAQGSPPLEGIAALYLVDMVGDCDLAIPREENSDPGLYANLEGPAFGGTTGAVLDDHMPFIEAGVPAVDLIDFTYGPGGTPGAYWHTTQDTIDKVCPASLGQVASALAGALGS